MKHANMPAFIIVVRLTIILSASVIALASEGLAFPISPTTLSYSASATNPDPPSQTLKFKAAGKKSLVPKTWTASGDAAWMSVTPGSGTITSELILRRDGNRRIQRRATSTVPRPPMTPDATGPKSPASIPDSNSPS